MEPISIVRRRSRVLPVVLTIVVVALLILAGLWMLGMLPGIAPPRIDARVLPDVLGAPQGHVPGIGT